MGGMTSPDTLTDHSATIRAEIAAEVLRLKEALDHEMDAEDCEGTDNQPSVELGYLVNTHRGHPLYQQGDYIAGMPVRLDRTPTRVIAVVINEVGFIEEREVWDDDDEEWVTREVTVYRDLRKQATW